MNNLTRSVVLMLLLSSLISTTRAQGDLLNETGIKPLPAEMTFQEYRDANRRLTTGILLSSLLPVPGMMHFYADEKATGYKLLGGGALGALTLLAGLASISEESDEWEKSDFETVDINGHRYAKVPVLIYEEGGDSNTAYTLKKINKKEDVSGLGISLAVIGGGLIIFTQLYDWIHGLNTIELKRDKVRFKYGKQLQFSMEPILLPENGTAGVTLGVKF